MCNRLPCLGANKYCFWFLVAWKLNIKPICSLVKQAAEAALFLVQLMRSKVSISSTRCWLRCYQQGNCTFAKYYCPSATFSNSELHLCYTLPTSGERRPYRTHGLQLLSKGVALLVVAMYLMAGVQSSCWQRHAFRS